MSNKLSERSRKMLQNALLELLKEKSFSKITITDLSRQSGLSRRTFYYHFETKEELFASLVDDILSPIFEELNVSLSNNPFTDSSVIPIANLFKRWDENREMFKLIRESDGDMLILHSLRTWFGNVYQKAVNPQIKNQNFYLGEYTTCLLAGATFMVISRWADEGMCHPPELMGDYLHSLLGPPAMKELFEKYLEPFNQYSG